MPCSLKLPWFSYKKNMTNRSIVSPLQANSSDEDEIIIGACPVCGGIDRVVVYRVENHNRPNLPPATIISRCSSCRTVFLDAHCHAFQEDLYAYYSKYFGRPMEELVSPLTIASYSKVLYKISRLTNVQMILDVGCGKGEFIWAAQRCGYKAEGLELADQAVAIAQGLGLPVRKMSLFSDVLDYSQFDLITMFEVIEHVDAPVAIIQRAAELLKPGGVLYITTPNYDSLDRIFLGNQWDVFHPEHITYFSTMGLARLVRQEVPCLQLVSVESNNISPKLLFDLLGIARFSAAMNKFKDSPGQQQLLDVGLDLRVLSEGSNVTRFLKKIVNRVLSVAGIGSTTILIAKKRLSG